MQNKPNIQLDYYEEDVSHSGTIPYVDTSTLNFQASVYPSKASPGSLLNDYYFTTNQNLIIASSQNDGDLDHYDLDPVQLQSSRSITNSRLNNLFYTNSMNVADVSQLPDKDLSPLPSGPTNLEAWSNCTPFFESTLPPSATFGSLPVHLPSHVAPHVSSIGILFPMKEFETSRLVCQLCKLTFKCKYTLHRHQSIHQNASKHTCLHCHKEFSRKDMLARHRQTKKCQTKSRDCLLLSPPK